MKSRIYEEMRELVEELAVDGQTDFETEAPTAGPQGPGLFINP
jgi:hypothetical protein